MAPKTNRLTRYLENTKYALAGEGETPVDTARTPFLVVAVVVLLALAHFGIWDAPTWLDNLSAILAALSFGFDSGYSDDAN